MNKKIIELKDRSKIENSNSGLTLDEIKTLQGLIKQKSNIPAAIIYGSRAKGTHKNGSDIDITLLGEQLTTDDLLELMSRLNESDLPYKFDLSIFHHLDNEALVDHIQRIGKILFIRNT